MTEKEPEYKAQGKPGEKTKATLAKGKEPQCVPLDHILLAFQTCVLSLFMAAIEKKVVRVIYYGKREVEFFRQIIQLYMHCVCEPSIYGRIALFRKILLTPSNWTVKCYVEVECSNAVCFFQWQPNSENNNDEVLRLCISLERLIQSFFCTMCLLSLCTRFFILSVVYSRSHAVFIACKYVLVLTEDLFMEINFFRRQVWVIIWLVFSTTLCTSVILHEHKCAHFFHGFLLYGTLLAFTYWLAISSFAGNII